LPARRAPRFGGGPVRQVGGNRGCLLECSFAAEAVTDVAMEDAVRASPRHYLIVHGGLINDRDLPYRFWRFASKNAFSRLSLKLIPKRTARNFVDSVERRLARTNFKHKSRLPTEQFEDYGQKRSADGFTDIVFGHFHQKVVMEV